MAVESEDGRGSADRTRLTCIRAGGRHAHRDRGAVRHGGRHALPAAGQVEPITERFIRVIEAGTERLITVIEFVSPTNKSGEGLHAFRAKRAELLASGVNFVEVDLVRAGDWQALLRPHACPPEAVSPYRIIIRVPDDPAGIV